MALGRRKFIIGSVSAGAVSGLLGACGSDDKEGGDGWDETSVEGTEFNAIPVSPEVFAHGVASGDPLSDRVLLWTRVTPMDPDADYAVEVAWVVATDPALAEVVVEGIASTTAARDFTVSVDAEGLTAGTTYYYAFAVSDQARSVAGRTRTLPAGEVERARFAFVSCSNYNNGYFTAYRAIAARSDLDAVIHLGDYIYEYADGVYGDPSIDRHYDPPGETITLADYRARYSRYRRDPDLQELHRQHPIIVVWDDHEVANDSYADGAENHMPDEGDWATRKRAGTQAFLEWLPVRATAAEPVPHIYRSFAFGNLFDLMMLDTRFVGRVQQAAITNVTGAPDKGDPAVWVDPARTLLGAEQESWLTSELTASRDRGTTWRLIGNQVIFSPVTDPRDGMILSADMWDGYQADRERLIASIKDNGVNNLVFLTGDIHTSWSMEVAPNPFDANTYNPETGEGAFAVELVGPSVTSVGLEDLAATDPGLLEAAPDLLKAVNPQVKFIEVTRKGYVLVDLTAQRMQAEWYFMNNYKTPEDGGEELAAAFTCAAGSAHLVPTTEVTVARSDAPAPAPSA